MCLCTCGGKRNCCGPIVPPNSKATNWHTGLWVIMFLHFVVLCIKCHFLGSFAAGSDMVAIIILLLAQIRYDYCLLITYVVINLFECFSLIVVLGYYLQTDMGQNVPHPKDEPAPVDPDSNGSKPKGHSTSKQNSIHIMFKGFFNDFLKMKYSFYQNSEYANHSKIQKASTSLVSLDEQSELVQDSQQPEKYGEKPKGTKLSEIYGPEFIIPFCSLLILFYIVTAMVAQCAYREWKGLAEDCAGGSIDRTDGNWLHYAIIEKREEAAIKERAELEKKRQAKKKNNEDQQPLMEDEEKME